MPQRVTEMVAVSPPKRHTWAEWLEGIKPSPPKIVLRKELADSPFNLTVDDRKAAWTLYIEMRTRVTTQQLHPRGGDEKAALDSIYEFFLAARKAIEEAGPDARTVAILTTFLLNQSIRPFTAKWHRKSLGGGFSYEVQRRQFRMELEALQTNLQRFQTVFGRIAERSDEFIPGTEDGLLRISEAKRIFVGMPEPASSEVRPAGNEPPEMSMRAQLLEALREHKSLAGWPDLYFSSSVARELQELRTAEQEEIRTRRKSGDAEPTNLVGLALSGGGIRSASFALGVITRLAQSRILEDVDFLSTVSGGGYTGGFLSAHLAERTESFPDYGDRVQRALGRSPDTTEPAAIRKIRNGAQYLLTGRFRALEMGTITLVGSLSSLVALLFLVVVAVIASSPFAWNMFEPMLRPVRVELVVPALAVIVYVMSVLRGRPYFRTIGWLLVASAAIGFASAAPQIVDILEVTLAPIKQIAIVPSMVAIGAQLVAFTAVRRAWIRRMAMGLFAISSPIAIVSVYLLGVYILIKNTPSMPRSFDDAIIALPLTVAVFVMINVNFTSPHAFYRERLRDAFLFPFASKGSSRVRLSNLTSDHADGPYPLVNTTVNLPGSRNVDLRGRRSDFFVLTPRYCGSVVTGYWPTSKLEQFNPSFDLASAIALSGAALAPQMGPMTDRRATFWLTMFNLRLGFWLRHPNAWIRGVWPNASCLYAEMFGWMSDKGPFGLGSPFHYLVSDGGHIENMGLYELLRRRCKVIISVCGEADPKAEDTSLMRLIRLVDIDLGIKIKLDRSDFTLDERGFARSSVAVGLIEYPTEADAQLRCGVLIYLKNTMVGDEPDHTHAYRRDNPLFPNDPVTDQFFDEAQFESYRALGYHVADQALDDSKGAEGGPATGRAIAWAENLVKELHQETRGEPSL